MLPGAPPAPAEPHNISQAYGRRAKNSLPGFGPLGKAGNRRLTLRGGQRSVMPSYWLGGKEVQLRDGEYMPDRMHNFVVDFITRHKDHPFYVYYSMSHVHADILPTPDTAPGTKDAFIWFQDNVAYMDKLVGKLVAELDRLKLRENTLIVFAGDNGTASPWYRRSTVHGKALSGHKVTMLECGALVPCFANWPGKIAGDQVTKSLINICDFFPTIAQIAGAKLPAGVTIDGRDFAPRSE